MRSLMEPSEGAAGSIDNDAAIRLPEAGWCSRAAEQADLMRDFRIGFEPVRRPRTSSSS
jgi:hypothetical protein